MRQSDVSAGEPTINKLFLRTSKCSRSAVACLVDRRLSLDYKAIRSLYNSGVGFSEYLRSKLKIESVRSCICFWRSLLTCATSEIICPLKYAFKVSQGREYDIPSFLFTYRKVSILVATNSQNFSFESSRELSFQTDCALMFKVKESYL